MSKHRQKPKDLYTRASLILVCHSTANGDVPTVNPGILPGKDTGSELMIKLT
jgi:hypothetical protein